MTPKTQVFKRNWNACSKYHNHSKLTNQHNWGTYMTIFDEHEFHHFDNEYKNHMTSKNYEESDYKLNLDSLTILYKLCVSHPRRSG